MNLSMKSTATNLTDRQLLRVERAPWVQSLSPQYGVVVCLGANIHLPDTPRTERRLAARVKSKDVWWLRGVRFCYGSDLRVLNISATGILVETERQLMPGSTVAIELRAVNTKLTNLARVVRCREVRSGDITWYDTAFMFNRPVELTKLAPAFRSTPLSAEERLLARLRADLERLAQVKRQKVIVRYRDGRVVQGWTQEFHPAHSHLRLSLDPDWKKPFLVAMGDVKALVFVREVAEYHTVCLDVEERSVVRSTVGVMARGRIELRQTSSDGVTLYFDEPADAARRWIAWTTGAPSTLEGISGVSESTEHACDHGVPRLAAS
jgi:hypothetical protein